MLSLFPQAGFDQSVTTPVLIGVLVAWFFTETFGWVFAGLVVPGYLAAVFLLHPISGAIDVAEALVTYFAARALGEHLSWTGLTTRAFGRERFFLVVLVSVLVRLAIEGLLLPRVAPHAAWAFSIGLVVVPLAANACWKTGLARGVVQNGIPTLVVYLLLRFVLVPHTNLSLEGFELATENVAASFLASPKAYILLTSGAVLAAAANVRYGWDFNGILVPALLGLCIVEPVKLLATLGETIAIVVIVTVLVRVTPLRRANLEGPRRTVLFFGVDYLLRFAVAALLGRSLPGGDIVVFMGFGYLVPTLLAVKIVQKDSFALVLLPAAKVSVASFALGTLIGFAALMIDRDTVAAPDMTRPVPHVSRDPIEAALVVSAITAPAGTPEPDSRATPTGDELWTLAAGVLHGDESTSRARGFEPQRLEQDVVLLRERFQSIAHRRGLPSVLVRKRNGASDGSAPIVLLVPSPADAPASAASAAFLLAFGHVDAVVLAGIARTTERWPESAAHATARTLAGKGLLVTVREEESVAQTARAAQAPLVVALGKKGIDAKLTADTLTIGTSTAVRALSFAPATLDSGAMADLSIALEKSVHDPNPRAPEEDLALRRLVLAPLVTDSGAASARDLVPLAARALGYRYAVAPGRFVLSAEHGARPLAIVARRDRPIRSVVTALHGESLSARDFALQLGTALDADAVVFGLGPRPLVGDAMRALHAEIAASAQSALKIVIVRDEKEAKSPEPDIEIASSGDDPFVATLEKAIVSFGPANIVPPDITEREMVSHLLFGPGSVTFVRPSPRALRRASLENARGAARTFAKMPLPHTEDPLGRIAARSPTDLRASDLGATEIVALVRRAAIEDSVTARQDLTRRLEKGELRAVLRFSGSEASLVALAKTKSGTFAIVNALRTGMSSSEQVPAAGTIASCLTLVERGGACEAKAP